MTIWLTGCTSGLGRSLVPHLNDAGHTVVGGGRNQDSLDALTAEFPESHFLSLDVAQEDSVRAFCETAFEAAGAPELLINNAAVINSPKPLWEVSAQEFDQLTAININGVANMIRHAVPLMLGSKSGIIINLSSGWGRSVSPEVAPYCASKWAIEGLTKALAEELPAGLAAVALNPGVINTPMLQSAWGSGADHYPSASDWAEVAAPYMLNISTTDNGASLTVPMS